MTAKNNLPPSTNLLPQQNLPKSKKENNDETEIKPQPSPYYKAKSPTFDLNAAILPRLFTKSLLRLTFGTVFTLYILNQKHLLPKPLSSVVSKVLFWPTLPITAIKRKYVGEWKTDIDDVVIMGGAPFRFLNYPQRLYEEDNVRGVINMCEEYHGPTDCYKRLGIEQLHLPTTDHFEPSVEHIKEAVNFIHRYQTEKKGRVYVHCRAGHGRSAAIVYAWLLSKTSDPSTVNMKELNEYLCTLRNVRETLWKQPNLNSYRAWLSFKQK